MSFDDREEWRVQPYDVPQMQTRVLLDVYGSMVRARDELV